METKSFTVEGLSCTDCAARIKAAVAQLDGVDTCEVDVTTGNLTVFVHTPDFDAEPVTQAVAATGHRLVQSERGISAGGNSVLAFLRFLLSQRETTLTAVAGGLTMLGLVFLAAQLPPAVWIFVFALAIGVGGIAVARHAFQELWQAHSLGINTLMIIAVAGAMAIGEWAEAAIVVVLFSLGEALESYATARARGALAGLRDLMPATAHRLLSNGTTEEVSITELEVGDRVRVRPGDRVSVDGVVRAGRSAVDQATITGESIPVDKTTGDHVFAGTINTFGALEVEVTARAEDNTLSRMITLVQEAQARQAPVQRFVDRFARIYTPIVTVLALLVAAVPPLVFGQAFWGPGGWLMRALQMLVIACPCALVISTPVSVVSALTNAASRGILIKGGRTLATLSQVRIFAFDKTGTLTKGRPMTTDVVNVCTDTTCPHNGLQIAASIETQSSHPLARALVAEANAQKIAMLPAEEVSILSGHGVTGMVNGTSVTVASHPYFDATVPHARAVCDEADRLSAAGKTVMLVCHDDREAQTQQICSIFAVADTPRAESQEVLETLRKLGGIQTVMLTGDHSNVAATIGKAVGVDEVRAGLLPEDKVAAIAALSATGKTVAMVGDGVNDAPALAQADVGIAMGAVGTAQAMETADVVLMGDDLRQLPFLVQLSQRTRRTVNTNIALALGVKALVFALAVSGIATLWMAIVADVGASLAVILNGMRLRRGAGHN